MYDVEISQVQIETAIAEAHKLRAEATRQFFRSLSQAVVNLFHGASTPERTA